MKIDLTFEEYVLIRRALATEYYFAKDEGNQEVLDMITSLEEKIIEHRIKELG